MAYELEEDQVAQAAKYIDKDKSGVITFEEFMYFTDIYIAYFDKKGERILKFNELLQRLQEDEKGRNEVKI